MSDQPHHADGAYTRITGGRTTAPLQLRIDARVFAEMETVLDDLPDLTRTAFVAGALVAHCAELARRFNNGAPWPNRGPIRRGATLQRGAELQRLQVWISADLRAQADNAVNGMKRVVDRNYTLRTLVEDALTAHSARYRQT